MSLPRCLVLALAATLIAGCPATNGQDPTPPPGEDAGDTTDDADPDDDADTEPTPADITFPQDRFVLAEGDVEEPPAEVLDEDENPIEDADLEWSSADPDVIEISSAGLAVAHEVGETTLTASVGDLQRDWPAEVVGAAVADVTVVPEDTQLVVGNELPYDVTLRDEANAPIDEQRPVEWSSTDPDVATIDDDGIATAVAPGDTQIVGVVDDVEDRADLTVIDADVDSVEISPASPGPLPWGQTTDLDVTSYDATGEPLTTQPGAADWTSSAPDVATVDATGLVEAKAPGSTTITASVGGIEDSVSLTVYFSVSELASGAGFSCAVGTQNLFCVGDNDDGQLADGTFDDNTEFGPAAFDADVDKLAVGDAHGCLVDTGGDVHCWGDNTDGRVGPDADGVESEPTLVHQGSVSAISAGSSHTCVVDDGTVYCWGDNDRHQLGSTDTDEQGPVSTDVSGQFVGVAAGDSHTCAFDDDGVGHCWGDNTRGQLGGTFEGDLTDDPHVLDGGHDDLLTISAGDDFTCALQDGRPPVCWGANDRGQLGEGGTEDEDVPLTLSLDDGESLSTLEAGARHTCGLAGGELRCWGAADDGRLAIDTTTDVTTPEPAAQGLSLSSTAGLAPGRNHGCAVTTDGQTVCWGGSPGDGPTPEPIDFDL